MKISIRRAIATLGLCALTTPVMAADYGYQHPTRLPAVHHAGFYSNSPYKTAAAPTNEIPREYVESAPQGSGQSSSIVVQDGQYGSGHAMPAPANCSTDTSGYMSQGGCSSYDAAGYGGMGYGVRGRIAHALGGGMACSPWFASASGLYFDRDDANEIWLSYDDANIASRTLGTRAAEMDWSGGFEVTAGRYFNCGMNALAVSYWGIYSDAQTVTVLGTDVAGNLDSSLNFNSVAYDNGGGPSAVNDWYDDSQVHQLRRDYEFHNVEINLLGSASAVPLQASYGGCGGLQMSWLAGIRIFKFDESYSFATDDTNTTFTGEIDELYHRIQAENTLVGFQLGATGEYFMTDCLSLTTGVKAGIYGNSMNNRQEIVGGTGQYAFIDNAASPYDGLDYNFSGSKTRTSFLGEIDLGLRYQASCNWSVRAGWRAMAVSGVALSINQFPGNFNFEDAGGAGDVETNGSLILHGGYLGAEYNY